MYVETTDSFTMVFDTMFILMHIAFENLRYQLIELECQQQIFN